MKKTLLSRVALISLSLFLAKALAAQNVGINDDNSSPDPNAMLDVKSTSKGVLFPRLTTAQRNVLGSASPTEGMLVFDTDEDAYFFFAGGVWVELAAGGTSGGTVPVGTVLSYAGHVKDSIYDNKPAQVIAIPGYLLCNGAEIDSTDYPKLARVIKDFWGNGEDGDSETMNLPDLRGMFLRGVNGLRSDEEGKIDRDSTNRTFMLSGGKTGNHVGSFQGDIFGNHDHGGGDHRHSQGFSGYLYYRPGAGGWDMSSSNGEVHVSTLTGHPESGNIITPQGGSESRPKNAYVHYIIKY